MRLIGLTGRSGCGKSTVGAVARKMEIPVLDCDEIYRQMTSAPSACLREIAQTLGKETVRDGALYRPVLRQIVFSDPDALHALNEITAKHMRPEIENRLAELDAPIALLDAPTLFQSGLHENCDLILGVISSDEQCISRIVKRDGIDRSAAQKRLEQQYTNEFFVEHCDIVLYNENDRETFQKDAEAFLNMLLSGAY